MVGTSRSRQTRLSRLVLALILMVIATFLLWAYLALQARAAGTTAYDTFALGGSMHELVLAEGTLAYDDQGAGPLVVMVPGLGDLRQEYRFLTPTLVDAGYRVVTVDLRGHGGSSVTWPSYASEAVGGDLLALIEHLDAGPATLIGNSFAAGPTVWAATENPDVVSSIVLIGPFVRDQKTSVMMKTLINVMFSGPWKVRAWQWYHGTLFPSGKPADYEAYSAALRANLAQPGRFEAVQAMLHRSDAAIEARLPRVDKPALVVMGTKDPDFSDPAAEASWIANALGGEVRLIEGAGHYPHAEMPAVTAPVILEFLSAHKGHS